jgi:hypothetical protein
MMGDPDHNDGERIERGLGGSSGLGRIFLETRLIRPIR